MGTNNFYNKNASNIFALKETHDFHYQEVIDRIICDLKKYEGQDFADVIEGHWEDPDYLDSFPSHCFCKIESKDKYYKRIGLDIKIVISLVIRAGYYSDCNFDWFINIYDELWGTHDGIDEFVRTFQGNYNYYQITAKQSMQYSAFIEEWYCKEVNKLIGIVEGVYRRHTEPLLKVAQFSNGEAIYKKKAS